MVKMDAENSKMPGWVTPPAITSLPDLDPILDAPYVEAFYMLDSSRQIGMGLGPIPLSEISNLWDRIELGEWEDFVYAMQQADYAYLSAYNDDPKNKPKS